MVGDRILQSIKLKNKKVLLIGNKVSCKCCLCCDDVDIDFFLYGPDLISEELLHTEIPDPDTPPQPKWRRDRRPSCARWVCIKITNGVLIGSSQYGGPTTNNLDLTQLLFNYIPIPDKSGCYIYRFDFYGWVERVRKTTSRSTIRIWRQASDTYFKLYKEVYETVG